MIDLTGKVAIVTGGTRGIGAEIVRTLARYGADVALNYRKSSAEAEALVKELEGQGRRALAVQADVASFADAQRMVDEVVEKLGGMHILVTNAGMNWDGVVWKMTEEQFDRVIEVDLKGTFNYLRACAPVFKGQNYGRFLAITSINGLRGKFGQTNYSAAKAGVIGLTKAAAKDLGKFGVTCNSVAPGFILTEMGEGMPPEFRQAAVDESAVKRAGAPEDVAWLVAFLASECGRHITGEVIKVDGGQYI
ncbi:MAG: 3-oxoacyl-ACP reductase family protein [Deferrisomatales bacterium]|nr:3-oxoacyl-ACP reductase family protein [Deferrisomatales bacterium]